MNSRVLISVVVVLGVHFGTVGCAADPQEEAAAPIEEGDDEVVRSTACSDGVFGTPVRPCAAGFICHRDSTAPAGPSGSSSATMGVCRKACSDGVFGTPQVACRSGFTCDQSNTAPSGPTGSSSAKMGVCRKQCGDGTFGTPRISCPSGDVCGAPLEGNTAPSGPSGSSSARLGLCRQPR